MDGQDVRSRRMARIVEDPDCVDDLFAVAMVLVAWTDFGIRAEGRTRASIAQVQRRAFGEPTGRDWRYWRAARAIRDDARTYRPPADGPQVCQAPTPRARRATCGKRYMHRSTQVDITTGERSPLMACGRHLDWFQENFTANQRAVTAAREAGTLALPRANYGGVLARHFPEIHWRKLWAELDPHWKEYPEVTPWAKPTLTVHTGGEETGGPVGDRRFRVVGKEGR